ncbi:hypothetical protein BLNAU_9371 [Blattamonas nauphoetae]|uniref:Protein kinase domain-containing protein n=1 Tax=Blattamonas nauphoetae TaxID=2049346 RepID=A0ABQ9XW33_9EUKA|nr:hypothetical protein BLNAU_9371 [Blattamonas nauphoetae]
MFWGAPKDSPAKSEDDFAGKSPLLYAGSKDLSPDLFTTCSSPKAVSSPLFQFLHSSQSPPLSPVLYYQLSTSPTTDIRSLSHAPSRTQFRSPQSSSPLPPHPTQLLATENRFKNAISSAVGQLLPSYLPPIQSRQSPPISPQVNTSSQNHGIFSPSWGKKLKAEHQVEKSNNRQKDQLVAYFRAMSVNDGPFVEFKKDKSILRLNKDSFHVDAVNPAKRPSRGCEKILQELDDTQTLSPLNKERAKWDNKKIDASSILVKYTDVTHHNGECCPYVKLKGQTCALIQIGVAENHFGSVRPKKSRQNTVKNMSFADRMFFLLNGSDSAQSSIDDHAVESFNAFLNAQSSVFANENNAARNLTEVGRATFHASNHIFRSETVSLVGHGSRLVHTNQVNSNSQSSSEMSNKISSERIPILGIVNASVTMTWWTLESVAWNSAICTVDESNVTISDCEIISSSLQSPFVVMSLDSAHPSSISVLSSRYTSTNDHMFPLVGLPPSLTAQSRMISLNGDESSNTFDVCVAETTIFGSDIAFSHEVLALGTGPLFSFGLNTQTTSSIVDLACMSVRTSLSNAAFVNVSCTSQLTRPTSPMFGSSMSQHVSSSRVSSCTNHDEGTAFLDVHFGGSLHALNTSFSDCSRQSNLVVDESHRNITQGGRLINVSLECTSVKYSHCTYCHMTSADTGHLGGAAILIRDVHVPLTLICCFFDDCTATVTGNDGGAVHYQGVSEYLKPCLFTNCSFTECKLTQIDASTSGGSLLVYRAQAATINHCFFDKSFAGGRAGAIYSSYCKFIVFNTAFVECETGHYGGAMFVFGLDPFLFHSVQFRHNKAADVFANSADVAMVVHDPLGLTRGFVNCNTTSTVGLYLCDGEGVPKENNTVLIPKHTDTFTISEPVIDFADDTATITVTASQALSGTMSFLLSGCLLPRLVHVEFGLPNHPSTTGHGIVTSGADGILPSPPSATYSVRRWSWGGHVFPPFVLSATASCVDAVTGQIDMTGIYLTSGTYSMVVRGSDGSEVTTVPVFESQSALTVTHGMSSTESNKLKYGMEYTIEEVRCDGELVRMESVYTFTIPYPASTMNGVDQTNDSDWTKLRFEGTNLVGARYRLTLETDDAVSPPHSTTVELSPSSLSSLSTWTAVLYPLTAPTLLYGRRYKVLSAVSVDGLHAPTITVGSFSTPAEPSRIVSLVLSKYEDSMKTAVFSVTGRALTPNMKYSVFVNVSGTSTQKEIFVTATGTESGIGKAVLFSTDDSEIELSYSTTYTVEGVEDKDGVSVLYHSGLTFTTGSEPMRLVTFTIAGYLEKDKKVEFRMEGKELETDETYDVSLSIGSSVEHIVSMKFSVSDDAWMGSALLYPLSDAELSYGVEYNVTEFSQTVTSTTTTHFFEANIVKIMSEPPRLTTLNPIVAYSDQDKKGVVSLSGIGLSGEYTVTMTRSKGLSGTETMSVSFDSSGKGTINGVLSGTAGVGEIGLKYGTVYEVSGMVNSSSKSVHIESDLVFETIAEPSRLTKVNKPTVGEQSNTTTIGFVGHHMVAGEYSVSLENTADETDTPTLVVTFASDGSGSGTASLHPTAELKYGGTYKVIGMTTSMANARTLHVDGGLTFSVTPEPSRLTGISLTGKLDKEKKVSFSCCGRGMKNGPYKIKLSGSKTISASFDESGLTGSGTAVLFSTYDSEIELSYSTTYTVEGVEDKDGVSVLYHSGLTFTTGSEPMRLVTFKIAGYLEKDKKAEFRMTGQKLETDETYDVSLSVGSSVEHIVLMKFSVSDDAWMGSALLYPLSDAELSYGVEYNVTEFSRTVSSTTTTHFFESNLVKLMAEPRRLVSIDSMIATGMNKSVLTLSSRALTPNDQYELLFTGTPLSTSNADHIFAVNVTVTNTLSSTVDVTLYPSGANTVKYGHEYVLTSMIQKGESESILFETDGCKFRTPSEPARLISITAGELKGDQKSLISLTLDTVALLPKTTYSLTLLSTSTGKTPSHKRVLTMTTTEAGLLPVFDACLYPFVTPSSSQLSYNTTYTVDSLSCSDGKTLVDFGISFFVPVEPARVEGIDYHLCGNRRRLEVTLIGRHLEEGMGKVCLTKDNQVWESLDVIELVNSTHAKAEFNVDETQSPSHINYQSEYRVVPMDDTSSGFLVNEDVVILVPDRPLVNNVELSYNTIKTALVVRFLGTNLKLDKTYTITLNSSDTLTAVFNASSQSSTEMLAIGWPDTLQYGSTYSITSIVYIEDEFDIITVDNGVSFTVDDKPLKITMNCDSVSPDVSLLCGEADKMCQTLDSAWIVAGTRFSRPTFALNDRTTLTRTLVIPTGSHVVFVNGSSSEPTLTVHSGSSSTDGSPMITLTEAFVEFRNVDVEIDWTASTFVFLQATRGEIVLKDGLFTTKQTQNEEGETDDVCRWETGLIELIDCTTEVHSNEFNHLAHGAVNMKGGKLSIRTSSFDNNIPPSSLFPSARRNIHCSEDGEIEIGSLNGGDGFKTGSSAWISAESCSVTGIDEIAAAPLFIPTLTSSQSSSSFNKTTKTFEVKIVGTTLIPCGLFLGVFEWDEKLKKEGTQIPIEVNMETATNWTETGFSVSVKENMTKALDRTFSLRARLLFGKNSTTNESFLFRLSQSDEKKAQALQTISWLIPVVASIITLLFIFFLVLILCRRRKQKESVKQSEMKEVDECVVEWKEDDDTFQQTDRIHESSFASPTREEQHLITIIDKDMLDPLHNSEANAESILAPEQPTLIKRPDGTEIAVWKKDTLYNRLHKPQQNEPTLDIASVRMQLLKRAKEIEKQPNIRHVLATLNPHSIFFDAAGVVMIDCKQHSQTGQSWRVKSGQTGSLLNQDNEGDRWKAPEMVEAKTDVDAGQAGVFSLGLILWELETQQVPFREYDAVNAQRQLGSGVLPLMTNFSDSLREQIVSCLNLDPKLRPTIAELDKMFNPATPPQPHHMDQPSGFPAAEINHDDTL